MTSAEHKELGTRHLSLGELPLALEHYNAALLLLPHDAPTSLRIPLHLNLSLTYLKLDSSPHLALSHALSALKLGAEGAQREKALFRAAQAEYALERWLLARERFEAMSAGEGSRKERTEWLAKAERRLAETGRGSYDWAALVEGRGDRVADYVNIDKLDIKQLDGGQGRGIVATKEIAEGELVALVKPYAACLSADLTAIEMATSEGKTNAITGLVDSLTQVKLADAVMQEITSSEPSCSRAEVARDLLFAGPSHPTPPVFPVSTLLPGSQPNISPCTLEAPRPDHRRIALSISYNSFTPRPLSTVALAPETPSPHPPSGLYLLPSLVNHSCTPNTSQTFFSHRSGLPMALRARRTIAPGEEIIQSYCAGLDFDARRTFLAKHVGPGVMERGCGCALCLSEAEDGNEAMARRRRLLDVIQSGEFARAKPSKESVKSLENLLSALKATYSSRRPDTEGSNLKPDLWEPFHLLSDHLSFLAFNFSPAGVNPELAKRSIQAEVDALRSLGVTSSEKGAGLSLPWTTLPLPPHEERAIGSCFVIASAYHALGDDASVKEWVAEGRRVEQVVFGTGESDRAWKTRWGGGANEYGLGEFI